MKTTLFLLLAVVCAWMATADGSPAPQWQQGGSRQNPQVGGDNKNGGWSVGADQTRGGGGVVRADADRRWDVSKDGKVKAEVHGHWERGSHGHKDHRVGGSIGGSWR